MIRINTLLNQIITLKQSSKNQRATVVNKQIKEFITIVIVVVIMTIQIFCPIGFQNVLADNYEKQITILFTHDMHDNFLPFKTEQNGEVIELGGYARLQSAINREKQKDAELLLVSAGDYSMGTLFQTLYASDALSLRILGHMGFDVITFGNHEFDFRASGLADNLNAAMKSKERLPQIVISNVSFPVGSDGKMEDSLANLKKAWDDYGIKDYTIIECKGVKIGVFGIMGKEAASGAPMSGVVFTDQVKKAKEIVKILQEKENVDLIICLSHSGTSKDKSQSEDEILAKKVPGIDVIISGHTHTTLEEPILVGDTIIGSCGKYGQYLGVITLTKGTDDKRWKLTDYRLELIDGSLPEDPYISSVINEYKQMVQEKYLDKLGMKFDDVLAKTAFSFIPPSQIGAEHKEEPLGNLIGDAYIYAVKQAEGLNYEPITAAIAPAGTIRGSFVKGDITVSDVFNVSSLGIGKDKMSGYPLISVYLTGKELKTVCEVDASIAPMMKPAQLYISGLKYSFNPKRLIFNRVTKVQIQRPDGTLEEIDDEKLYRVVVGLYSAQVLSIVGEKSFGLLSIQPKAKDGSVITNFEDHIIIDTSSGRNNEIKEWLAIAQYLQSFEKIGGVPQVPEYYSRTHGRKIVENESDILSLLSYPNKIALMVYSVVVVIFIVIILLIFIIIRRRNTRKRRNRYSSRYIEIRRWH